MKKEGPIHSVEKQHVFLVSIRPKHNTNICREMHNKAQLLLSKQLSFLILALKRKGAIHDTYPQKEEEGKRKKS